MNILTVYLTLLTLFAKTEALNAKLGKNRLKKLFHHVKEGIVEDHRRDKAILKAHIKSLREGNRKRRDVLSDEINKLRDENMIDQGYGRRDSDLGKRYHLVGNQKRRESLSGEHKVTDTDLKALQLELEKKVVDDIDKFVQQVGAY